MKKIKKALSLCMAVALLIASSVVPSYAAEGDYEFCCNLEDTILWRLFSDRLLYDTVNGAEYIYIVEDGEATILNVQINYWGPEKISFTFPETLGGYPVTKIGYSKENGYGIDVFHYIKYGDDFVSENPEYSAEIDPSMDYVSEIIIPEGYKYIEPLAFYLVWDRKISFPKSLRLITGQPFESLYTHKDASGKKYTVLPECQYDTSDWNIIAYELYGDVYFPSRLGSEWLVDNSLQFYPGTLYIPSNYSYETIRYALFQTDWHDELDKEIIRGDEDKGYGERTTIHCAPDSEFLRVFDEAEGFHLYTVITDVVPAEYIEFPEETVNVCVGDVVDLEAKTYPAEAVWTACDYTVSDPSIVQIDDYSGRITALKEGTVTVTATHCERGFVDTCTVNVITEPEPVSGINEIKPATDTPYYSYSNRDYRLELTGSPSKIQLIRENGTTTTIDRSKATINSNGETETWIVNMRVEAGEHSIRAKFGNAWDEKSVPFTVTYDTPKAYSFDLTYENGIGTFDIVTDPQIAKIQLVLDNGTTLTYSQSYSYIGEDGLRHWTVTRKASVGTNYTLKTKLGYTWTTTDLKVTT